MTDTRGSGWRSETEGRKAVMAAVVANVSVAVPITNSLISNLLCCAFEGGSNYWIDHVDVLDASGKLADLGRPGRAHYVCDQLAYGGFLRIHENGAPEERVNVGGTVLDLNTMVKGIRRWVDFQKENNGKTIIPDVDAWDFDADDGDGVLQFALFGELVYG